MGRKECITKDSIIETAFIMTKEEGFSQVTARKLAQKIGCSTQPIFRSYENMKQLGEELYLKAAEYYDTFYETYPIHDTPPIVHLGLAYIQFAAAEPRLFELLFLSEHRGKRSLYELINGDKAIVSEEINKAVKAGCKDGSELFMKLWIFIHGAACMAVTKDYDLSQEETKDLLIKSYNSFFNH